MNARPVLSSWLLLGLLIAGLRGSPIPAPTADPKETLPPALQMGATKAPAAPASSSTAAKAAPTAPAPTEKKSLPPATITATPNAAPTNSAGSNNAAPASNPPSGSAAVAPTVPPATAADQATSAASSAPTVKPGILSAAKAKGPPPVGKGAPAPAPLSPRFQQIRTKIGVLFDTRNSPPAPTDPLSNPFRPAGALPVAPLVAVDGIAPPPPPVNNDLASLQQAVGTLRVKGTVQRGKTLQLVITSASGKEGTYKEGDIINVLIPGADPVHVRVRQISTRGVTLTLGDAEMVLKF